MKDLNELSSKTLANYSMKANNKSDKEDNRISGQWMADQKVRKAEGKSSSAKIAATVKRVVKESRVLEEGSGLAKRFTFTTGWTEL